MSPRMEKKPVSSSSLIVFPYFHNFRRSGWAGETPSGFIPADQVGGHEVKAPLVGYLREVIGRVPFFRRIDFLRAAVDSASSRARTCS